MPQLPQPVSGLGQAAYKNSRQGSAEPGPSLKKLGGLFGAWFRASRNPVYYCTRNTCLQTINLRSVPPCGMRPAGQLTYARGPAGVFGWSMCD